MNKVIGILIGVVFVSIFSGNTGWFPEFFQLKSIVESVSSLYIRSKALTGIYVCYVTAAASVYFIVSPTMQCVCCRLKSAQAISRF